MGGFATRKERSKSSAILNNLLVLSRISEMAPRKATMDFLALRVSHRLFCMTADGHGQVRFKAR